MRAVVATIPRKKTEMIFRECMNSSGTVLEPTRLAVGNRRTEGCVMLGCVTALTGKRDEKRGFETGSWLTGRLGCPITHFNSSGDSGMAASVRNADHRGI